MRIAFVRSAEFRITEVCKESNQESICNKFQQSTYLLYTLFKKQTQVTEAVVPEILMQQCPF